MADGWQHGQIPTGGALKPQIAAPHPVRGGDEITTHVEVGLARGDECVIKYYPQTSSSGFALNIDAFDETLSVPPDSRLNTIFLLQAGKENRVE